MAERSSGEYDVGIADAGYLFSTSQNNHENYSNATADGLYLAGPNPSGQIGLWASLVSWDLPMNWIPSGSFEIAAARKDLTGSLPPNTLLPIFEQRWLYK